jgi:hypothetical protein
MPRVISLKKAGMLTLLCVFGLLAVACGGAGGEGKNNGATGGGGGGNVPGGPTRAAVPAGYTPVSAGQVSIAYPPGWRRAPLPKGWTLALELRAGNVTVARLGVITNVPQVDNVKLVSIGAFAAIQIAATDAQRGRDRELRIPGATSALRVDYTYLNVANGGASREPARGTDVSVVYGDTKAATIRIAGLQRELTPQIIDQIVGAIAVTS